MSPIDDVLDYVLTDHTWLAADAALRGVCDPAMAARARAFARHVGRDGAKIAAQQLENEFGGM